MYSEQFMAYLAGYQQEEQQKEEVKRHKPNFWLLWFKALFGLA